QPRAERDGRGAVELGPGGEGAREGGGIVGRRGHASTVGEPPTGCKNLYDRRMVRRDEDGDLTAPAGRRPSTRCTSPAGASPVPVGAGAPGSRPPSSGRDPAGEAGRRKPLRREQERGPQHEVKPAASTDPQRGSRA